MTSVTSAPDDAYLPGPAGRCGYRGDPTTPVLQLEGVVKKYRRGDGAVMQRLRAGWLSFRRIHLAALIADWRRTLLSAIGVAVGVTVVLGTLILKSELARPFDAYGPSLSHAADRGVVEVTPNVSGRLPIETADRLRAEVAGAEAVIPIVAGLTPVDGRRRHPRVLSARRVVPNRATGRLVQLRAARPR